LVGFDHESDSGEMREAENKLIKEFELPDSLIIRNIGHP
jgi:probable rRNA maturation factor